MAQVPSNLIPSTVTQLAFAPEASAEGLLLYTLNGVSYKIRAGDLLQVAGVPTSRQVIAGTGLQGGGALSSNVTLSVAPGGIGTTQLASSGVTPGTYGSGTQVPVLTVDDTGRVTAASTAAVTINGYVPDSRQVIAGPGLTGGGPLSSNVTLTADLSSANPLALSGTGSAGISTSLSRADHRHPAVDLADQTQVDGILPLDQGGTARSIVPDEGAIVWSGADGLYLGPVGGLGQVLVSGGAGEYVWGSAVTLAPMPANHVFAGPASGPNALSTFRLLVNADIPAALSGKSISLSSITASSVDSTPVGATSPSTGAFTNLTANYLQLNIAAAASIAVAKLRWNVDTATAAFGIIDGTQEVNIGQQMYAYVTNAEAVTITRGQAVYLYQAAGNRATVKLASNVGDATSAKTLGLAAQDISANQPGFVITQGVLDRVNTGAFAEGTTLYLGPTAGSLTSTKPQAPNHLVYIGVVERANAGNGQIYVKPQNGYELDEIHDVRITSVQNNDLLQYYSAGPYWRNVAPSTVSVGTATNAVNTGITDDTTTAATVYPTWVTTNTGNLPVKVSSTKLTFNPSTGVLTATGGVCGGVF